MKTRTLVSLIALASVGYAAEPAAPAVAPTSAVAPAAAPASAASIKELLELSNARGIVDTVLSQIDNSVKAQIAQADLRFANSPDAQKVVGGMEEKIMGLLRGEMSWEKLEPMYIRTYQQAFSQSELDGLVAFYKTPTGQALMAKMPAVMQGTQAEVQQIVRAAIPKARAIMQQTMMEAQALEQKEAASKAAAKPATPAAAPVAPAVAKP